MLKVMFIKRVIAASPQVIIGKEWDYRCISEGDNFVVYRRKLEGRAWQRCVIIPKATKNKPRTWIRME